MTLRHCEWCGRTTVGGQRFCKQGCADDAAARAAGLPFPSQEEKTR